MKKKFIINNSSSINEYCTQYDSISFWKIEEVNQEMNSESINIKLLNAAIFFLTNEEREKQHLSVCEYNNVLESSSMLHSSQMKIYNFFSHENLYNSKLKTVKNRIDSIITKENKEFSCIGENIADYPLLNSGGNKFIVQNSFGKQRYFSANYGNELKNFTYQEFAHSVVVGWMNSEGHRKNILTKEFLFLGCGVDLYKKNTNSQNLVHNLYFKVTQNFGGSLHSSINFSRIFDFSKIWR